MLLKRVRAVLIALGAQTACAWQAEEPMSPLPDTPGIVWIYRGIPGSGERDTRSDSERLFAPFGFMPAQRTAQISVNPSLPVDPSDRSQGTCVDYYFEFKTATDWLGSYTLVDGNAWGTKHGINIREILHVTPDTELALRFTARGEGAVTFKIGGVRDGPHKSSLLFARHADPSPTTLTSAFREYTIGPILARELVNLIDPFCVVSSALDNPGRVAVHVQVRSVFVELFNRNRRQALPDDWRHRLSTTLFIAYTPTGFDPTASPVKKATKDDIRADLAAIRALADDAGIIRDRAGVVLYGCRDGIEEVAPLAREVELSVLLGIFNPLDPIEERNAAALLARSDLHRTIVACCVGNEAITFRRASLAEIQRVVDRLRTVRAVPMTTTEIVQSYGDKRLFSFDFTLVNAHGIFSNIITPDRCAQWALDRISDLRVAAPDDEVILVKEIAWPSLPNGPPPFTDEQQAQFWRTVLRHSIAGQVNVCIFDGFSNVGWKNEMIPLPDGTRLNVGPYWPVLFDSNRKRKAFADELLKLWAGTRGS